MAPISISLETGNGRYPQDGTSVYLSCSKVPFHRLNVDKPHLLTFTCTCVGIQVGRIEPASLIELTTSQKKALQAGRSCVSSLESVTQSFIHLCALRGGYCHHQRPPTSFRRLLVRTMSHNRRAKSSAQPPSRPCPLYATTFHAATKDKIAGERMRNEQD